MRRILWAGLVYAALASIPFAGVGVVAATERPAVFRVFYDHGNEWEHLGEWDCLSVVPHEWIGVPSFVIIKEQRIQ